MTWLTSVLYDRTFPVRRTDNLAPAIPLSDRKASGLVQGFADILQETINEGLNFRACWRGGCDRMMPALHRADKVLSRRRRDGIWHEFKLEGRHVPEIGTLTYE